jgi:hypothetical protein
MGEFTLEVILALLIAKDLEFNASFDKDGIYVEEEGSWYVEIYHVMEADLLGTGANKDFVAALREATQAALLALEQQSPR